MRPDAVGAMDGLPATARDEANRIVLEETRAKMRMELDSIPKPPANEWTWITAGGYPSKVHTDEWMDWHREYGDRSEQLKQHLKGMQYIQDRFDRTGEGGLPEAYLLGFDPVGLDDGKIIMANGNPDVADHVAVYVPGTHAGLEKIGENDTHGDLGRGETLWAESSKLAPGQKVSTITWLDYDASDSIVSGRAADRARRRVVLACTTSSKEAEQPMRRPPEPPHTPRFSGTATEARSSAPPHSRGAGKTPRPWTTTCSQEARASKQIMRLTSVWVRTTSGRWADLGTTSSYAKAVA